MSRLSGRALKQRAVEILQLLPQVPEEMVAALQGVEGAARLADFIAGLMDVSAEEKQALLETFDLKARLDKLLELLARRIEVLKVSREVDERTRESISDINRKHLLREQMRTIQKGSTRAREATPSSRSSKMRSPRRRCRRSSRRPRARN